MIIIVANSKYDGNSIFVTRFINVTAIVMTIGDQIQFLDLLIKNKLKGRCNRINSRNSTSHI